MLLLVGVGLAFTQQRLPAEAADDMVARIRAEGLQRSRAMAMYRTLTDEIGARLTGSPAHKRAANWARDRFAEFGLANPHLEPYEFGRGWELEQMSVAMTEPRYFPLIAYAEAWTPSTKGVITGRAVYVGDKSAAQIQAMAGQLRGAIVLTSLPIAEWIERDRPQPGLDDKPVATGNPALPGARSTTPANDLMPILQRAGAAVALRPSAYRDGTVGVLGNRNTATDSVPSIIVAGEQYNILTRLAASGHPPALRVELRARSIEDDRRNFTRFSLLRRPEFARKYPRKTNSRTRWKTSLVFTTRNVPGALFRSLSAFALRDLNLAKIESRPLRGKPWEYLFYLDFLGRADSPNARNALNHLREVADFLRVLGSYPKGA